MATRGLLLWKFTKDHRHVTKTVEEVRQMGRVQLRRYNNAWYQPGRSKAWRLAWFLLGLPVLRNGLLPFSSVRVWLLRCFGAVIGEHVTVKPGVRVKYPWHLRIDNDSWIGEDC